MPKIPENRAGELPLPVQNDQTLDPVDWEAFRAQAHSMLDNILDYTKNLRSRPVWQPIPEEVRARFRTSVPALPSELAEVHREFADYILPFAVGNAHPGFMGWVHGGGTPVGMLAEMLSAGLNANLGGRDQIPIEVERQIARWMQEIFGFPETAAGLFVTGTSMANFIAVVIARDAALGCAVRKEGVFANSLRSRAYASTAVHGCISKAMDLCGLGSDALRLIPTDARRRMDLAALQSAIKQDREAGFTPFLVVGSAGTVDTGAIDDLTGISAIARREKLWFHVDGAYGALAMLAPNLAPKLQGIEQADSLAFDFHKWGQVPYDAGFILVRDGAMQRNAFAASNTYLRRETRGLAAGSPWPCDHGPDLSRGFRALKTWFTLKFYGTQQLGSTISRTCALARYLEQRVTETPELELLAPVELNVVCFRYRAEDSDRINAEIVVALQESGKVAPSTTILDGHLAIRAAIVNHRTAREDVDALISSTLAFGRRMTVNTQTAAPVLSPLGVSAPLPWAEWENELQQIEHQLATGNAPMSFRFRHAFLLGELGRFAQARDEYIELLKHEPHNLAALNNLARILIVTGHRRAAQVAYKQALVKHPDDRNSRVRLGHLLLQESEELTAHGEFEKALQQKREARQHFDHALLMNADDPEAHEGLSYLLGDFGDMQGALGHRRKAFTNRFIIPIPFRGRGTPIQVLRLSSPAGGNVRLQRFLDDRVFQTFIVIPEFYDFRTPLPPHQLVVNAIGDAEASPESLIAAQSLLSLTPVPVINPPQAVLATTRSNNAQRLSALEGVVAPITVTMRREQLSGPSAVATLSSHGLAFPILLRAPGFHTGMHFVKVESPEALPSELANLPGNELIAMQYLDATGADGKSRKYRAMMINGQIYPLHAAISSNWKIHYFTAEMADNPEHRAEDEAFLEDMPGVLGPRAMAALQRIQSTLGLDYAGIDFGLSTTGDVLLFEANATMVVNPPDADKRWSYRIPAYKRIRMAVEKMIVERSSRCVKSGSVSQIGAATSLGQPEFMETLEGDSC